MNFLNSCTETALELLKLDESLAGLKNKMGMTGLQLLAGVIFVTQIHLVMWQEECYFYFSTVVLARG